MSAQLVNIYAPVPETERGRSIVVGAHPKGETITYAVGRQIIIRNVQNPLVADIYYEHSQKTTIAKYAPSGFYIASGDVSGKVRIWDTVNKEHILKIELPVLGGEVRDLAWSQDNQRIVAVGVGNDRFGVPFLWDSGSSVGEIGGHSKPINSVDFKQTRPFRVQTASEDFSSNWYEGPPFKFKHSLKDHSGKFVNCVRFSPDGNRSLTVGGDKKGFFYDGKTGEKVGEIQPVHTLGIYSCSWAPTSQQFCTASADKTCRIFNADGSCTATVELGKDVNDQQLGCLWVNNEILSFSLGGDYHYIDPSGQRKRTIYGHNKLITALAYDQARNRLISASFDGKLVLWDVQTGENALLSGKGHSTAVVGMGVSGNHLVSLGLDDSVLTSDLTAGAYGRSSPLDTTPLGLAVGRSVSIAVTKKSINVIRDGAVASTLAVAWEPTCVSINPDESTVAVGGNDKIVHLFSLSGGKLTEQAKLERHRGPITAVEYAPDGKLASADSAARELMVWAGRDCKTDGWVYHTAKINSIAWAPDSTHLATAGLDSAIYIWNFAEQGKRIHIPNAHPGGVNCIVSVNANTFASAGQDAAIKTWAVNY